MWFLVSVVKGSKHFEPESPIGNRVLISDTSEMTITGRASYTNSYRFEARIGNESFVVGNFVGAPSSEVLVAKFLALAKQLGAVSIAAEAAA